jgi:starch-binding outer membrane protein, SusD/RagB family
MKKQVRYIYTVVNIFSFLLLATALFSCKKLVEVPPPAEVIFENAVFTTDATAISVLTGLYATMTATTQPFQGNKSIALFGGLSSDELTLFGGITSQQHIAYFQNNLAAVNQPVIAGSEFWAPLYNNVYKCNAAIEGLNKSTKLIPTVKQQLLGEAKFMRAFFYFYLVNLFGDLPLVLAADPVKTSLFARSSKAEVYNQIIDDLKDAQQLLSTDYLDQTVLTSTNERVRPTKWAATALLARTYLYTGEWAKAESESTAVINSGLYNLLPSLNDVFLKNSYEAIWQLQPTLTYFNTYDGYTLIIPDNGPSLASATNPVYLSQAFLNNFEADDQRAVLGNWVNRTIYKKSAIPLIWDTVAYPYKYKVKTSPDVSSSGDMSEYIMVLRLGEQYLIRAEARAQLENIGGAQQDLNAIRNRAGLGNTSAGDKNSLLTAILHERQVELFSEWGHRWFDLKRTGKVNEVMNVVTPQKAAGEPWRSFQQLYPLPNDDIQKDANLRQNQGY